MTTIRIDTLRNQIAGTRELLGTVLKELEDLHTLAYDRNTALSEAKVSGGSHDYALDTHGDPRAKAAYRALGDLVDNVCNQIREGSDQALNLMAEGASPGRKGPRHLRLAELGETIAAQVRRTRRGDYTPFRRGPQPDVMNALEELRKERDKALRERDAAHRDRDRAEQRHRDRRGSSTR